MNGQPAPVVCQISCTTAICRGRVFGSGFLRALWSDSEAFGSAIPLLGIAFALKVRCWQREGSIRFERVSRVIMNSVRSGPPQEKLLKASLGPLAHRVRTF